MAHVFLLYPRSFFYPFGNTPSIGLTDHISPEEDANVLLLGCGDARSLLYTLSVDETHGYKGKAKLDVTCCDMEPAVLARNILLYTLLADSRDTEIETLWNLYYDIYISDDANELLLKQSKKLATLAKTMEDWHASSYGKWLRMVSENSLASIRGIWQRYADAGGLAGDQKDKWPTKYTEGLEESRKFPANANRGTAEGIRAFGSYILEHRDLPGVLDDAHKKYWNASRTTLRPHPNPTLMYSGGREQFNLQNQSNPILGFHLFKALVQCKGSKPVREKVTAEDFISEAKEQFSEWCAAFRNAVNGGSDAEKTLTIRFFSGDYAALCTALQFSETSGSVRPGIYPGSWNVTELILNNADYGRKGSTSTKAPTKFNFIDTSNLLDHVGLVNLMITARPLLQRGPSSVMLTEAFMFDGSTPLESLGTSFVADPLLMATIFDVFPSPYFMGYSTKSNSENCIMRGMQETPKCGGAFERLQWKFLNPVFSSNGVVESGRITMEADQLAKLLFNIYFSMFAPENVRKFSSDMAEKGAAYAMAKYSSFHYSRESFAKLIAAFRSCISSDWDNAIDKLLNVYIQTDDILLNGFAKIMDLNSYLFRFGIFETSTITDEMVASKDSGYNIGPPQIRSWIKTAPKLVYISLVVPRKKVACLFSGDVDLGSPTLLASVKSKDDQNFFYSLQMVFGKIQHRTDASGGILKDEVLIQPDENEFEGESDLIVIFQVPSWIIRAHSEKVMISFSVENTPHAAQYFQNKLQMFETELTNEERVFISRNLPNVHGADGDGFTITIPPKPAVASESVDVQRTVQLDSEGRTIASIVVEVTGFDDKMVAELQGGATVSMEVDSANSVMLKFGSFKQQIGFPLPINKTARTRIARKSKYIEVIATPGDLVFEGLPPGKQVRFPLVRHSNHLSLWNMHRVFLDKHPTLDLTTPPKWIQLHLATAMSKRDRSILAARDPDAPIPIPVSDSLTGIKEILTSHFQHLLTSFVRTGPRVTCAGDVFIFMTDLKLDLANACVLLDLCILPIIPALSENPTVRAWAHKNLDTPAIEDIDLDPNEEPVWKELLVSAVERARGNLYQHHPTKCEYRKRNTDGRPVPVPLSYEQLTSPFCSCSRGSPSRAFMENEEWAPLRRYVSRAAVSLLFCSELREPGCLDYLIRKK